MHRQRGICWRLSTVTTSEAEDALSELLASALGQPMTSYTDSETGVTTLSAYMDRRPSPAEAQTLVSAAAATLKANGLNVGDSRVSLARVRKEDWAESWKRYFKPLEITPSLLIKPGWSRRRHRKGQRVVVIDPGLSFGTGQHPTTAFCLRELANRHKSGELQSFLDLGCGSGILAIAAAKLGYLPVHAYDIDPDAIRIARANARRNRVERRISFQCRDITTLHQPERGLQSAESPGSVHGAKARQTVEETYRESSIRKPSADDSPSPRGEGNSRRTYHLICANLTADLLVTQRDRILSRLEPHGVLVLAGVLKNEFSRLRRAFESAGLRLIASRAQKEWQSGSFRPGKTILPGSPSPRGSLRRRPSHNRRPATGSAPAS